MKIIMCFFLLRNQNLIQSSKHLVLLVAFALDWQVVFETGGQQIRGRSRGSVAVIWTEQW